MKDRTILTSRGLVFRRRFYSRRTFGTYLRPFVHGAVNYVRFNNAFLGGHLGHGGSNKDVHGAASMFRLTATILFRGPVRGFTLTPGGLASTPRIYLSFVGRIPAA